MSAEFLVNCLIIGAPLLLTLWAALRLRQPNRQLSGSLAILVFFIGWTLGLILMVIYHGSVAKHIVLSVLGVSTLVSTGLAVVSISGWERRPQYILHGAGSAVVTLVGNILTLIIMIASRIAG